MKIRNIFALAVMAMPLTATAQTLLFEEQDYQQIGVYDTWVESPFRTGELKGNFAVVDNPFPAVNDLLGKAPNDSKKVLAIQRSRFGSNTFGVRVDLKETFELTPQTRYIHVMVNRPYAGRVMVVGLGKRRDRAGQSAETEQFWAMSTNNVPADRWEDVVLPIKGNGGIDIYSLVIVPDCESPHHYTADQVCYIDNIEINNEPASKFVYGYYPVNFGKNLVNTRGDRYLSGVQLTGAADGEQHETVTGERYFYHELDGTFEAKAGETVTPKFLYQGQWMHGYVYMDLDNNGQFNVRYNADGTVGEGSELMTYSFYEGINSKRQKVSNVNVLDVPAFQIPQGLKNGFYRMRYKVDWNNAEPAGALENDNALTQNGGGVIDIRLNIHGDICNVNDANRNGEVLSAKDQLKLVKYKTPFGQPFTIRMNPEKGFEYSGIIVKHGYNLSGDSVDIHGNVQWVKEHFERQLFNGQHEFTIPGRCMDGDVEIEGLFIEEGTYVKP